MSTSLAAEGMWVASAEPVEAEPRATLDLLQIHSSQVDFVWATLQRLGVRERELEDATQDAFLVVHRRLDTFDSALPLRAWLYGICRRVAASHRRRAHHRRELPMETVPDLHDRAVDPEEHAMQQQAQDRLDALLDELDDDKRVVFVMFEIEGMSCDEIAESLAIPTGTVYSRLHAARRALQKSAARSELWRSSHERSSQTPSPAR